jgi:hypothetical protein
MADEDAFAEAAALLAGNQGMPQNPVRFALTPALSTNTVLDYASRTGAKLFDMATAALETPFDMRAKNVKLFIEELSIRSTTFGWNDIMGIPRDLNDPLIRIDDLMTSFGTITIAQVRAHAATYVDTETRVAQDSYQLYLCIMATLTKEAKSRIVLQKESYYVNRVPSGTLLFRLVIQESSIDTNATTRFLREQLSSLNKLMIEKESNVIEFNESVRGLLDSLASRGESTQDLLSNLFKGYEAASDEQFVKYVLKKQDDYDEGADITPDKLMLLAAQKYRTLVQAGKWNAPDEKMQKIIALEATIKKIQKSSKPSKDKKPSPDKEKKGSREKEAKAKTLKPDWMMVKPKEGEAKTKTVDGKEYHWCPNHESWTRHSPADCKGKGVGSDNKPQKAKNKKGKPAKPKLSISRALQAIAEDNGEESE